MRVPRGLPQGCGPGLCPPDTAPPRGLQDTWDTGERPTWPGLSFAVQPDALAPSGRQLNGRVPSQKTNALKSPHPIKYIFETEDSEKRTNTLIALFMGTGRTKLAVQQPCNEITTLDLHRRMW